MTIQELLDCPEKWTTEVSARDCLGMKVLPNDRWACQWCLYGAIMKCYGDNYQKVCIVFDKIKMVIGSPQIGTWNDRHNFNDIRTLIERLKI